MRTSRFWTLALLCGVEVASRAAESADFSRERATEIVKAHTTFLADDLLEGRGAGTRGHELAARYVAAQFARIGLQPVADHGTYAQRMSFRETLDNLEAGRLTVRGATPTPEFTVINDVLVRTASGQEQSTVSAPAVFVGFAVRAPELKHDDFGDVDLRGKIAVWFYGAPRHFPTNPRAYYSDSVVKSRELVRRGAVGSIVIFLPRDEARYPWAFVLSQGRFPRMRLVDEKGQLVDGFPELKASATMNSAAAARLFTAAGRNPADVLATAERGDAQRFSLGLDLELSARASVRTTESLNVVGLLPGSDPALAGEPLVVTSHLDHIGIGPAVDGDTIYNGTMDNAIGVGVMLAAAEHLAARPPAARPVLFAALTGEEKGLLGAQHLALHPPKGVRRYAANFNVDMPVFSVPVRDVVARGQPHSTLGQAIVHAASRTGFTVSPDPIPDEVIFIRSDQYSFVQAGVPALYLGTGVQPTGGGSPDVGAQFQNFLKTRYHKPNDDLAQPIDWPSAGAFADLATQFARLVAEDRTAPAWYEGDFFGQKFGGDAPRAKPPEVPRP